MIFPSVCVCVRAHGCGCLWEMLVNKKSWKKQNKKKREIDTKNWKNIGWGYIFELIMVSFSLHVVNANLRWLTSLDDLTNDM